MHEERDTLWCLLWSTANLIKSQLDMYEKCGCQQATTTTKWVRTLETTVLFSNFFFRFPSNCWWCVCALSSPIHHLYHAVIHSRPGKNSERISCICHFGVSSEIIHSGQTNLDALSGTFSGSISSFFNFVYRCLDRFSNQWQSIYADQSQREANIAMNQWELTISWNLLFARSGAVVAQLASARLSKREVLSPGARFSKVPRTFRARKAIRKTTTRFFRFLVVKLMAVLYRFNWVPITICFAVDQNNWFYLNLL